MRSLKWITAALFILAFAGGCSETQENPEKDSFASSSTDSDSELDNGLDSGDMEQLDQAGNGQSDNGQSGAVTSGIDEELSASEKAAESGEPLAEAAPAPVEPPPAEAAPAESALSAEPSSGGQVKITGLDYRAGKNSGTVVIRTDGPAEYTTRSSAENSQFVVEVKNATLPRQFKRPYNTKEFTGPIAGIQGYQKRGAATARIVIQMRDDIEPVVQQEGNSILVVATGSAGGEEAADMPLADGEEEESEDDSFEAIGAAQKVSDPQTLSNKSFDSFLLGQSKFYGKPMSIQLTNAEIKDVFNLIAEHSGLNIVLNDAIKGKITLRLRKIPWDQALVVVMKANQLGYIRQGNVLRIAPLDTIKSESDQARKVLDAQRELSPLRTAVFPISYAKAEEIVDQSKDFLTPRRGSAKADKRSNSVIVTDIEENIERIKRLVETLDTQTPQVLIEAKIVEARQDFQRLIGVDFAASGSPVSMGSNSFGAPINLQPGFRSVAPTSSASALTLSVGTLDFLGDIDARLNLFELDNKVKVISSPKIVALNGKQSNIEQTTEVPIKKSTTNGTTTTDTFEFKPLSLKLAVTPQISSDGSIVMEVKVQREFLGADSGQGARPVNKRAADTTILVQNGQTAVMGGIFQSDVTEGEGGVPFLRKIPIIGSLFKSNSTSKEKNELLIFLTPRVLNSEKAFRSAKGL